MHLECAALSGQLDVSRCDAGGDEGESVRTLLVSGGVGGLFARSRDDDAVRRRLRRLRAPNGDEPIRDLRRGCVCIVGMRDGEGVVEATDSNRDRLPW